MLSASLDLVVSQARRRALHMISVLLTAISVLAQDQPDPWKVTSDRHGALRQYFGTAISVDRSLQEADRRVLIGAPAYEGSGRTGSAFVFLLCGDDWVQEQELRTNGPVAHDSFGEAVSIYDRTALVAAPKARTVYIFRHDGTEWKQEAALRVDDPHGFGWSVSACNDRILIGAKGKAFIFRRNGTEWTKETELGPSGLLDQYFGRSVSLNEHVALVGAPEQYDFRRGSGCAYVFRWDGSLWIKEAVLRVPDGRRGDAFGYSVSLCRDSCVIGAPYRRLGETHGRGVAYAFRYEEGRWILEQEMTSTKAATGKFGKSVSIDGDLVIVGAPEEDTNGTGATYIYRRNAGTWVEASRFVASDSAPWDFLGDAVSIGGGYAAVGAPQNKCDGDCHGAVYILQF